MRINRGSPLQGWRLIALRALVSALILLALKCKIEVVEGLETGSALLSLMSKLSNAFAAGGVQDVLTLAGIFALQNFVGDRRRGLDLGALILAAVFAPLYVLAQNYRFTDTLSFFNANLFQRLLSGLCLLGFLLLFYLLLKLAYILLERPSADWTPPKRLELLSFIIIFLCWLPWTLMNYPGSFCPDSAAQLGQYYGLYSWSSHQPPVSSATMGLCVDMGISLGSRNFGAYLYLLLHSVVAAMTFSLSIKTMAEIGGGKRLCIAALVFFALTPLWGCFAQWFEKDLLYAAAALLLLLRLAAVVRTRSVTWRQALNICVLSVAAALLRNGGIYEFAPALLLIALYIKRPQRRRMLSAFLGMLVIYGGLTQFAFPSQGIAKGSVREMLSVPFQQTALYVQCYDSEVTDAEREAIDAVLVYDKLDQYDPRISDPVKNNYRGDNSKLPAYFSAWFRMFLKHPGTYAEAFLLKSSGYLAPAAPYLDAYIQLQYPSEVTELGISRSFGETPARLFDSVRQFSIAAPVVELLAMPGLYTWILLACFVLLIKRKKAPALLLFVPGIMDILICLASPLHSSMRYELPVLAMTPLLLGWTKAWLRQEGNADEKS